MTTSAPEPAVSRQQSSRRVELRGVAATLVQSESGSLWTEDVIVRVVNSTNLGDRHGERRCYIRAVYKSASPLDRRKVLACYSPRPRIAQFDVKHRARRYVSKRKGRRQYYAWECTFTMRLT